MGRTGQDPAGPRGEVEGSCISLSVIIALCVGVLHHPVGVLFTIMTNLLDIILLITWQLTKDNMTENIVLNTIYATSKE